MELFNYKAKNQFMALIDTIYSVGEKLCDGKSDILNQNEPQRCVLFLKGNNKTWCVDGQGTWEIDGTKVKDTIVLQLDLTKCKMTDVTNFKVNFGEK